ncbi:hypothetical protein ABC970_22405 [Bacillus licheniformis]|uniref:hypothetical protein n=1 Tax=Bacillus TaxID=1386 RepID=UPI00046E9110|nr:MULTISPECIES: hypothetical protein [Bacillus]ASK26281.1 hypothetical protein BSSX_p0090 [Bacillus subtilis]MCA1184533.1 hypothetical protein [Bacillus licheniformis]MCQ5304518.1 hypothetical protein [Bacillus licheniformis]MDM5287325.1 hypothetical protein [Bacillus licheniformis]MEC0776962.1 hypothetical protein [Bacillus licheniformis]
MVGNNKLIAFTTKHKKTNDIKGYDASTVLAICEEFANDFSQQVKSDTGKEVVVVYNWNTGFSGIFVELYAFEK